MKNIIGKTCRKQIEKGTQIEEKTELKLIKNRSKKRSLADAADVRNNVAPKCQNGPKIDQKTFDLRRRRSEEQCRSKVPK